MGRVMALDVGKRWVGVAISDPTGTLARGVAVLDRRDEGFFDRLKELMDKYEVIEIVVGIPMDTRGGLSLFGEEVIKLARKIRSKFNVEVSLWNEAYTTKEAMRIAGKGRNRRKIDMLSAELILQGFLERSRLC